MTMTTMKTWEYKTSNGQNNISVNRVQTLQISQPFSANNNVKSPKFAWFENGNPDSKLLIFYLKLNAAHINVQSSARYAEVEVWRRKRR